MTAKKILPVIIQYKGRQKEKNKIEKLWGHVNKYLSLVFGFKKVKNFMVTKHDNTDDFFLSISTDDAIIRGAIVTQ